MSVFDVTGNSLFPELENEEASIRSDSYEFDAITNSIIRKIMLRTGEEARSAVIVGLPSCIGPDLAAEHDLAWLRSKTEPIFYPPLGNSDPIRIADLFCGCGGLSIGVREACRALQLPINFAFANDFNTTAMEVYSRNFNPDFQNSGPLEESISGRVGDNPTTSELDLMGKVGRVDFVIAGPPCQGHSDLNNHTRREDPKNQLILKATRFVELFRPKHVLIENVQGIKHDKLGSLGKAMDSLRKFGYEIDEKVLSAEKYGAAQARKRFFLLGSLVELHNFDELANQELTIPRPISWAIDDLCDLQTDSPFDSPARHSQENINRINYMFNHGVHDLPDSERPPCHRDKVHSYKGVYGRMFWDRPAPTITTGFGSTGQGRFVHPLRRRTLTPHEAARVQFFPDFFNFGDQGRRNLQELIGNAVPSKLAYAIALNQLR